MALEDAPGTVAAAEEWLDGWFARGRFTTEALAAACGVNQLLSNGEIVPFLPSPGLERSPAFLCLTSWQNGSKGEKGGREEGAGGQKGKKGKKGKEVSEEEKQEAKQEAMLLLKARGQQRYKGIMNSKPREHTLGPGIHHLAPQCSGAAMGGGRGMWLSHPRRSLFGSHVVAERIG
jgi:hypothetical protein